MAEDQSAELLRELRRIRSVLLGIVLVLAGIFAAIAVHGWFESIRPPQANTAPDLGGIRDELRAIRNELSHQKVAPPVVGKASQ